MRNEKIFENTEISPRQVLARIQCTNQEYSSPNSTELLAAPSRPQPAESKNQPIWTKPPFGTYKVNTDASFSPSLGTAALAMVARDSNGYICLGMTWSCMALSALMPEAAALLKAVKFVKDMGQQEVIFESDSQTVISGIQQPTKPLPWEVKSLLMNIRKLCDSHPGFKFSFVPRDGNRVADWVLRSSLQGKRPLFWTHRPPKTLLSTLLSKDVNHT
ncbi:hypothetical protein SLE2022_399700 [Rubroshorea leprosula]